MKFDSLDLHADILKGVVDAGFERCTPIQEQSLPECLAGKDMIAQSQTGTGKTAVFVLTIYSRLMNEGAPSDKPKALVMVPTRELAVQVEQDASKLGKHLPFKTLAIFGGVDYDRQVSALKGGIDLVVATPGRMIDLYKSKTLSLDDISIFVIDEADRMFDMGFAPDITYIASRLPKEKPRQTMLFSATIDSNVERLASRYMKPDTIRIEIEPEQVTVDAIDQKVIYVSNEEKLPVLMGILKRPDAERVIIFTNMKRTAEMLEWKLQGNGLPAKALTGDMTQARRQKVIDGMKAGTLKILVATDVAARGLHIDGVTHVINYDLPEEAASYVHRVGRTARAGKTGKAYSLVCESYAFNLPEIEKYLERKIESEWIDDSDMVADTAGKYTSRPRGGARTAGSSKSSSRSGGRSSSRDSSSRGSSSRGPSSSGSSSRGEARPAPRREAKPAPPVRDAISATGDEVDSTSWSEVKSALKKEVRSAPDSGARERSRTEDKDKPERERPGRIVRPERVRKPRPAPLVQSPVEATGPGGEEGAEDKSGAPRRRRRRRRPSGAKVAATGEKQAASSGQEQAGPAGRPQGGQPAEGREGREGAEGTSPARRRRRRPPRGRGDRPPVATDKGIENKAPARPAPAERGAPAPKPAAEPKKTTAGGLLKKVLGVFKKK